MTTTASKHGLRKAAGERRDRHAQRTPLPPKPGVVEAAKEAIRQSRVAHVSGKMEPKGREKAEALMALGGLHGWNSQITGEADMVEIVLQRGTEAIHQAWVAGVYHNPSATYTIADRTTMTRNLAATRRLVERIPDAASAELERVASNKAFRRRETKPKIGRLPFDPSTASEKDIIDALVGKGVAWHNRFRQVPETALMSRDPRRIRVEEQNGERVVLWCCPATGFRAFRLSALMKVGKSKALTAGRANNEVEVEA